MCYHENINWKLSQTKQIQNISPVFVENGYRDTSQKAFMAVNCYILFTASCVWTTNGAYPIHFQMMVSICCFQ